MLKEKLFVGNMLVMIAMLITAMGLSSMHYYNDAIKCSIVFFGNLYVMWKFLNREEEEL